MAYNIVLGERIDQALKELAPGGTIGKKMFGGVGYMINGNMACGVLNDFLIVRVGKEAYENTLKEEGTSVFDTSGRPMTGWVTVAQSVLTDDKELKTWVRKGVDFALTLPKK